MVKQASMRDIKAFMMSIASNYATSDSVDTAKLSEAACEMFAEFQPSGAIPPIYFVIAYDVAEVYNAK